MHCKSREDWEEDKRGRGKIDTWGTRTLRGKENSEESEEEETEEKRQKMMKGKRKEGRLWRQ